ncbi:hypothetical protein L1987_44436 [Smallanthus sonchifolius]|uniref:Uncharacterized protein n=1 Tax=Smallanthus sonchifolius TaxID=185202 RepID=A0ACB9GQF2_9ASTR|nr:hypothetical protein L1987_44436 [Smallanthus sonchifolius]
MRLERKNSASSSDVHEIKDNGIENSSAAEIDGIRDQKPEIAMEQRKESGITNNQRKLRHRLDPVSASHDKRRHGGSGDGRNDGVSLLVHIDLPIPPPPGSCSALGNTRYCTAGTPGLGGGLVAGLSGDSVGLTGVFGAVGVDEVDNLRFSLLNKDMKFEVTFVKHRKYRVRGVTLPLILPFDASDWLRSVQIVWKHPPLAILRSKQRLYKQHRSLNLRCNGGVGRRPAMRFQIFQRITTALNPSHRNPNQFSLTNTSYLDLNFNLNFNSTMDDSDANKETESGDGLSVAKDTKETQKSPEIPPPPEKPLPGDCCGSGCVRCVWDVYFEELAEYNKLYKGE